MGLDIHVFWVDDLVAMPVNSHTHDFYQLTYCKKSGGKILIGDTNYEAREGFVYFAPPFTAHAIENNDSMHILEVKFLAGDDISNQLIHLPPVFSINNMSFAKELLFTCVKEGMKNDIYYQESVNYTLRLFLIAMLRSFTKPLSRKTTRKTVFKIPEHIRESNDIMILNLKYYMEDHLSENISLDELAESVHFNKSYFVKRFKILFGEPPMKYLNNLRIERSKQLLKQTELPIAVIAAKTGFPSPHYFSRLFRAHEGISPKEFRCSAFK